MDYQLDIYRHFTSAALLPCLIWDHVHVFLRFVAGLGADASFAPSVYAIVACRNHWFAIKLTRSVGVSICEVFDEEPMSPDEWNRFFHQFVLLVGGHISHMTVHFVRTTSPFGMCGFSALWHILHDCQLTHNVEVESLVMRIQNHPNATAVVEMCNQASQMWSQTCSDNDLVGFAQIVRMQFLDHLLRTQNVVPFCQAGAKKGKHQRAHVGCRTGFDVRDCGPKEKSGLTLSSLALRFDRFLSTRVGEASHPGPTRDQCDPIVPIVARLKEFRPLQEVCECSANNFAAMVQVGMIHETDQHTVTVQATLIPHDHE